MRRGSLTLWVDDEISSWWLCPDLSGRPGASETYSDRAIEACLSLRILLRLPLRQTEGFVRSILCLMGLPLMVPDYTTLARRQKTLPVALPVRPSDRGAGRHIVIDSTGLKIFGEGEWKVRKHGKERGKRRVWRKLHVSVDEKTGEVTGVTMTVGDAGDGPELRELIQQSQQNGGRIAQVSADGAYDSWEIDRLLTEQGIVSTIPPRKGSKIKQHGNSRKVPLQRDENLRQIRKVGRENWAKESGYTRRSLAETHMMREKRMLGPGLMSRTTEAQTTECRLRCAVLNRLAHQGMPDSYPACSNHAK